LFAPCQFLDHFPASARTKETAMEKGTRNLRTAAAMVALVLAGGTSRAADREVLSLVVHVKNQAGISSADLARAQVQTGRIFEDIGVRIVWSDVAVESRDPRCEGFSLLVTLLSPEVGRQLLIQGGRKDVLSSAESPVGRAFIHPERVADLGARTRASAEELLGRVMAHELGHLMLPVGHSQIGIMSAGMETDPARTSGRFTVPQTRAIRALLQSKAGGRPERAACGN
jgi:hypothetical protein